MIRIKTYNPLLFMLFVIVLFSCNSSDDAEPQDSEEITATKEKLVGDWKLVSSTIDNESVSPSEFECLKNSTATFKQDGTYKLTFLKQGSSSTNLCSLTRTQSGEYTVTGLNKVTLFNFDSEIELIDDTLQITSKVTNDSGEQDQIDIFIRSDNAELEENEEEATDNLETDGQETDGDDNTFDGTEVIQIILGKWQIDADQDCLEKNTMEFKPQSVFEFIQHKKTFNRRDLLDYNVSVSYPLPENIKATITKGNDMVVFDTDAECQFTKTSTLEYVVKDEKTIVLKNISGIKLLLEDNDTIKLVYTFTDSNANEQTREFIYKKL
ncbi:lipocalin family protein [Flagellimonas sp. HMM57]|uniref:lipocalin family protein n=1 Tax=unclassified Flagellimonas TaxID=2644544 RepID=UPI0013D8CE5B|nr:MULTISPECIES: lipocalin family protein [unclassified Flagellimonas]UII76432.1 lipocalin family protein [Flagellimonas sp. HMM57]